MNTTYIDITLWQHLTKHDKLYMQNTLCMPITNIQKFSKTLE